MYGGVTLQELLRVKAFSNKVRLVNLTSDLHKVVTHVTIMEAPDFYEWTSGGELVLTTWYAFSVHPELAEASFRKLCQQISAIGIKINRYIKEIPPNIIKIADEYHIPVFEIFYEVKFRELVTTINSQIQYVYTNVLIEIEEFYDKIMQQSLESDDIGSIVKLLSKEIGKTIICFDGDMKILSIVNNNDNFDVNNLVEKLRGYNDLLEKSEIELGNVRLYIRGCYARKRLVGILLICTFKELNEIDKLLIKQSISFLSMKLWNLFKYRKTDIQKFWQELVQQSLKEEVIKQKFKELSIQGKYDYNLCIIKCDEKYYDNISYVIIRELKNPLIIEEGSYLIIISNIKNYEVCVQSLYNAICIIDEECILVNGPKATEIYEIRKWYFITRDIFNVLIEQKCSGIFNVRDYIIDGIMYTENKRFFYDYIEKIIINPMCLYDKQYNTHLLKSLYTVLNCNGLELAARKLYIHVNTLRYRLSKSYELTTYNYFEAKDRPVLYLALTLWHQRIQKVHMVDESVNKEPFSS